MALFRANGFEGEELVELRGDPAPQPSRHNLFTPAWAAEWPADEIWRARKSA